MQINQVGFLGNFLKFKTANNNVEVKGASLLTQGGGMDTVEISASKGDKFDDVFKEFTQNVPDRTTTIEEKTLAIEYIDRLLACNDIRDDLKTYWQNKKDVIEMEIQNIKNEEKLNTGGETVQEVWKEFSDFTNKHFRLNNNLSFEDKFENRMTYYATYKTFCLRFLACEGLTDEQRAEYYRMMQNADRDIANWERDYSNYIKDKND